MSSKQTSSKTGKAPASSHPVPTGYEPRLNAEPKASVDGSSSSNGTNPRTNGDLDSEYVQHKLEDEDNEEQEDTTNNQLGTQAFSAVPSTTIIKYGGGSGLFGDSSIPSILPAMPKLAGPSAHQYNEWKLKATNYFQSNGLSEVVTMEPMVSLELAVTIDGSARPRSQIKALWVRLHSKAYGAIRAAVESIIGTSFFEEIESDTTTLTPTEVFTVVDSRLDRDFKSGCAYYLWDNIRRRLEQFTPHDLSRLVERYMSLKYTPRSNPIECRASFDSSVRDLKLAGIILPDKLHLAVWYKALPPDLDSLRQALGAKPDLKSKDIYDAIVNQYSSKKAARNTERSEEKAHAALENEEKKRKARTKRDKNRSKPNPSDKSKKHCDFCELDSHNMDECYSLKKAKSSVLANRKARKISDSEADDDHAAVFVEDEVAATFQSQLEDELAAVGKEAESGPTHFLFDSGATTHVTPVKHIIKDINNVPIMTMSTAITGERQVINKRGQVRLNDKWTLRDVAYVPRASSSLISEGRLCDAGYEIYKNKDFVHVRKAGKTVLRGVRVNRLWAYTVDGSTPTAPRPVNTLVPTKPLSNNTEMPDRSEGKTASSNQPRRQIPKKVAPKPTNASDASSSPL
jgi:hypothetical protein